MEELHIINRKLDSISALLQNCFRPAEKDLLNTSEAAIFLGLAKSTLYKHTSKHLIPFSKPNGKLMLFKKDDLKAWLEAKHIPSLLELKTEIIHERA